jgi:hypothetical protein
VVSGQRVSLSPTADAAGPTPSLRSGRMTGPRSSRDPRGREIVLTGERWEHITAGHPELEAHQEEVLRAVEAPTQTAPGRAPDEEWFYLADAGPSRWLKVVVVFDSASSGRIITAFPRRRKP